jgi:hypothetical protein
MGFKTSQSLGGEEGSLKILLFHTMELDHVPPAPTGILLEIPELMGKPLFIG